MHATIFVTSMGTHGLLQPLSVPILSQFQHCRSSLPLSYFRIGRTKSGWMHKARRVSGLAVFSNLEDTPSTSGAVSTTPLAADQDNEDPDPQDLEYVSQIKRVLELLKNNRDMFFDEVKLTIMIEDPRDVERKRLLGIDDENAPTRDDLADALVQINKGQIPKNRAALQMLAEELLQWPNLEVQAQKQQPGKSLYAKVTDTGVDPKEAAKRLSIDWDSAADIKDAETADDMEVPPAMGYGALYLVTAFPVIIGISVVLILFFNSLQ